MFDIGGGMETRARLVDTLRAQHRAAAIAQAAEVDAITALYHSHYEADRATGINAARAGEFATTQAATALVLTEAAASGLIDLGLALEHLPCTQTAFTRGDIDLARAKVIADALINLDPELVAELEQRLVGAARTANPARLRQTARRWVAAADPDGDRKRRERRMEDRDVRVRPTQDGMSFLDGLLPAAGAATLAMRLRDLAMSVCCHDPRSFAQRRADALIALGDGTGVLVCACGREDCIQAGTPSRKPSIQVGVSLDTLLGLAEYPGFLAGYGAIDADLARKLAADGTWELVLAAADNAVTQTTQADAARTTPADCTDRHDDPDSSRALTYQPCAALDRWIRARDGHCRFPGCVVPAANCDIDHSERFNRAQRRKGGKTIRRNLACLCRRHHRLKTLGENGHGGWRMRQLDRARIRWTTPTGEIIITEPAGAAYLWPGTEPPSTEPPSTEPPSTEPGHGGSIECSDPWMLRRLQPRTGMTAEDYLSFLVDTHIAPKPTPRQPKTFTPRTRPTDTRPPDRPPRNQDPDEPPPF